MNTDRFCEAEINRVRGEWLRKTTSPNPTAAFTSFQRAIGIARKQGAKSLELRIIMSLARLLASQGRCDDAPLMLAEIYGWFTKGLILPICATMRLRIVGAGSAACGKKAIGAIVPS